MEDVRPAVPFATVSFVDSLRRPIREQGYAWQTDKACVLCMLLNIRFHDRRHPAQMRATEVNTFLGMLGWKCLKTGGSPNLGQVDVSVSNNRYPQEFLGEAVKRIIERGYSARELSKRPGVSTRSLYKWLKAAGRWGDRAQGEGIDAVRQ